MTGDPYSRVYWRMVSEFPEVWNDVPTLGAWVRLLVQADGSWPAPAPLPRWLPEKALRKLTDAGLVVVASDGHHYRIRGMDAERGRRSNAASNAARNRWSNANRNADGTAETMPSREEPRKSIEKTSNGSLHDIDSLAYDGDAYKKTLTEKTRRRLGVA